MKANRFLMQGSTLCIYITLTILLSAPSFGATFCVNTATDLQSALTTAASNGGDNTIKIVQGTYNGNFTYASTEGYSLILKGGYIEGCTSQEIDPINTIVDGGGAGAVMALVSQKTPNFLIQGLTLQNGDASTADDGGGLYAKTNYGQVTLTDNIFTGNAAANGGGAYIMGHCTLTNNTFSDNNCGGYGGGAKVQGNCTLINNTFSGNISSANGGGAYIMGDSTLTDNTFSENNVHNGTGGGVDLNGDSSIMGNTFINNTATALGGGACVRGKFTLTNNTFSGNHAGKFSTAGGYGGGAYVSGSGTLTNNTFSENAAEGIGGGIVLMLYDNAISGVVYNNIFWNNLAPEVDDFYLDNSGIDPFLPISVELFNNNFDQSSEGTYIEIPFAIDSSNLDIVDPLFAGDSDYHLTAGSPCINAGSKDAPGLPGTDKDGNPRILDGTVDMGAYEFVPLDHFIIAASASQHGTIYPGPVTVPFDGGQSFTIRPDIGWYLLDVQVDGSSVGAANSYTFTDLTSNHTIHAIFTINPDVFGGLPDTGQTNCYNNSDKITCPGYGEDLFGQDASYLINPPSYTKLDDQGRDLPDDAIEWTMVRDNVTGLIWEVKTDDGSIHDKDNIYSWYDSNPDTNSGDPGKQGNGTDTEDFINALNTSNFGGFSDWRLPTINELTSIVILNNLKPAIDRSYFPSMTQSDYNCWSSTTMAYNTSRAWSIDFYLGNDFAYNKLVPCHVLAVRGGKGESSKKLVFNGDGTVTSTHTGLMWQVATDGQMNWEPSLSHCASLSLGGFYDWRLPTRRELRSIIDYQTSVPAIDINFFPDTASSYYFSSTTYDNTSYAWLINFQYGEDNENHKTGSYYTRAVRGGQNRIPGHLVILIPAQGSRWNIGSVIPLAWEPQDIPGNVEISISRQGGKDGSFETIAENTENDGIYDWSVTGPLSCNCVLKIKPLDDPSKATTQSLFTIGSTIPPIATISGAPDSPTNQTDVTLTVGGESIFSYRYKLDDGEYGSEILVANPIVLTDFVDGPHPVYVLGRDAAGDWQIEPTTATWTVDTVPPTAMTSGTPSSPTNQTEATLNVIGEGVTHYKYKLDSGAYKDEIAINEPISLSGLTDGSHTLYVIGRDLAGNWQTEVTIVTWAVDTMPPTATISGTPPSFTDQTGATLTIGGEGVTHYKYKLDNGPYGSQVAIATPISITALTDGSHAVYVIGLDSAGNWQAEASPTTAAWTVDTIAPAVTGLMDDPTPTASKTWIWDANKTATFRYDIDQNATWTPFGNFSDTKTATVSGVIGTRYIHVQAKDLAGNRSEVVTVSAVLYTSPTANTGSATSVTANSAILNGAVHPNGASTKVEFEYGLDTGYGSAVTATQSPVEGSTSQVVSAGITPLAPRTTYHFRVKATNSVETTFGDDQTFTTSTASPTVTTGSATSVTSISASLNGAVNPNGLPTTCYFEYGTTTGYGSITGPRSAGSDWADASVAAHITGLNPNTTYHYRVVATNSQGTSNGQDATVTTSGPAVIPPTVITGSASAVSSTSATLNGMVNPNGADTSYYFEYGKSTGYGLTTANGGAGSGTSEVPANALVTGLSPNTTYYYRLVAANSVWTAYGTQQAFTSSAAVPIVITGSATSVTTNSAVLNGTVNPSGAETAYHFEYGTTISYGSTTESSSAGSGTSDVSGNVSITGLSPNTAYHYRLVAASSAGTTNGTDQTFSSLAQKPSLSVASGTGTRGETATLPITLTNVDSVDIAAVSFDIGYDTGVFGNPRATIGPAGEAVDNTVATSEPSPGVFRITVFSASNNTPIGDGVVAYLELRVTPDAPVNKTTLTVSTSASDPLGEELEVEGSDGVVTILGYLAGDCNDDVTISIAEVQSAINMFLDILPVEDCVDVNGNGRVTVGEVQKVVNNHLGGSAQDWPIDWRGIKLLEKATSGFPLLTLGAMSGLIGETISVPITLHNTSGYEISALSTDIAYDTNVLENPTLEIGPAGSAAGKKVTSNEISSGNFRVGILADSNNNVIADGVLAYVTFDIKSDALLGQTVLENLPEGSDPSGNDLSIEGKNGAITPMTVFYVSQDGVCDGFDPCFSLIQDAIDAAHSFTLIKMAEGTHDEALFIDKPATLTVQGGWDAAFTTKSSNTAIDSMEISGGTVTVDNLVIQ